MYKHIFAMGRSKKESEREKIIKSLRRSLFVVDGLCNSNDYPFQGGLICGSVEVPESAPAVFLEGGFRKIDEVLSKYPEASPTELRPAVVRVVEFAGGVEPRPAGSSGLLLASTGPTKLELTFAFLHIYYEPGDGQYVRQVRKRWLRKYVELEPLDPGLIGHLAALLERAPDLYYFIVSPNILIVKDYNTEVRLVFKDGKLKEKHGQTPLTWYIEGVKEAETRLKKAIQPSE